MQILCPDENLNKKISATLCCGVATPLNFDKLLTNSKLLYIMLLLNTLDSVDIYRTIEEEVTKMSETVLVEHAIFSVFHTFLTEHKNNPCSHLSAIFCRFSTSQEN